MTQWYGKITASTEIDIKRTFVSRYLDGCDREPDHHCCDVPRFYFFWQAAAGVAAPAVAGGTTAVDVDIALEDDMGDQGLALDTGERLDSLA